MSELLIKPAAAVAAAGASKALEKIGKSKGFDRLLNVFRKKHRILVLGATGAGKSNFLHSLAESAPATIDAMNRTEFAQKHSLKISQNLFVFVDTPGQAKHKPRRIQAIREAMSANISGIVNVVAYGYHEARASKKDALTEDGQVRQEFLAARRNEEIAQWHEWTPLLGDRETGGWLITLVTKADLWWDRREEVLAHYEAGTYFAALGDAQSLSPSVVEYSSVFHRFYGDCPICGFFDDGDRDRVKANLIAQLLAAIGKGELE